MGFEEAILDRSTENGTTFVDEPYVGCAHSSRQDLLHGNLERVRRFPTPGCRRKRATDFETGDCEGEIVDQSGESREVMVSAIKSVRIGTLLTRFGEGGSRPVNRGGRCGRGFGLGGWPRRAARLRGRARYRPCRGCGRLRRGRRA